MNAIRLTKSNWQDVLQLDYQSGVDGANDWALVRPPQDGVDTWIVCIHGHGSHGDQLYTRPDIRDLWLPNFQSLGFGIMTPNLRDNTWMAPAAADDLKDLITYLRTQYDAHRFIFASGSMGGTSNLIYAVLHPEDADAVIALCPASDLTSYYAWCRERNAGIILEIADAIESAYSGDPSRRQKIYNKHSAVKNCRQLTMPLYVVHGTSDPIIPVSQSRNLMDKMSGSPKLFYDEITNGGHDSPLSYMPNALDWIAAQL